MLDGNLIAASRDYSRQKAAFTLVELLVVVGILAILAAIAIPNFRDALIRAKIARVKSDHRMLSEAAEAYAVEHGTYPPWDATFALNDSHLLDIPRQDLYPAWIALTTPIAFAGSAIDNFVDPFAGANMRYEFVFHPRVSRRASDGRRISEPIPNRPAYYEAGFGSQFGATDWFIETRHVPASLRAQFAEGAREIARNGYILTSVGPDRLDSMAETTWGWIQSGRRDENGRPMAPEPQGSTPHWWNEPFITYDPSNGADSPGDIYRVSGRAPEWWGFFTFPRITP